MTEFSAPTFLELYGEGVTLRELRLNDAELYFNLVEADRGHLSQFGDTTADKYPDVLTVEQSILNQPPNVHRFGIWNDEQDIMVGLIKTTQGKHGVCEVGYWVGGRHTGHGYASRSLPAITEYSYSTLHAPVVYAEVVVGNQASRKSLEKSGYVITDEVNGRWIMTHRREQ